MSEVSLREIDLKAEELKQKILNAKGITDISGTAYYVSNNGSDDNDGLSPETAWKTLKKASDYEYCEGDAILLERGSVFREPICLKCENTILSAYGEGEKPKILGSLKNFNSASDWAITEYENVYLCTAEFPNDVGNITADGGKLYGFRQVIKNFGFEGKISELKADMEFYYDKDEKKLYLYSLGHPAERFSELEIGTQANVVIMADGITVDNVCCKYAPRHAITGQAKSRVTVQNCEVGWAGGAILCTNSDGSSIRYGNAIEIYGRMNHFTVKNNYIYQIYDSGITHQYWQDAKCDIFIEDVYYAENLIEYCCFSIEYALAKQSEGGQHMKNVLIEDNIMRYAGEGFGMQRPDKKEVAHLKTWETCNTVENVVIRNNILDRSEYMLIHVAAFEGEGLPEITGNTYIQKKGGELGRYGTVPTKLCHTDDENFLEFDKDAKILII